MFIKIVMYIQQNKITYIMQLCQTSISNQIKKEIQMNYNIYLHGKCMNEQLR